VQKIGSVYCMLYNSKLACFYCLFQSVTGAMNTINPPVSLSNSDNEHRVEYIQNVASQPDYEITEVGILSFYSFVCCFFFSGNVCFCDIVMAAVWSAFLAYLSCRHRTIWEIRFFYVCMTLGVGYGVGDLYVLYQLAVQSCTLASC